MARRSVPAATLLMVAGEASGDRHGAALVQALRLQYPEVHIYGLGGEHMRAAGVETLFDVEALSAVGAMEYCMKYPRAISMSGRLSHQARQRRTRVAVLIDAPGFNLPLAGRLKRLGVRVIGYVSPQVWAWRPGRVKVIARRFDKMLTLFPFEAPIYTAAGMAAEYVGHPLIDALHSLDSPQQAAQGLGLDPGRPIVALLPGSRRQEIDYLLMPMLQAFGLVKQRLPHVQGILPVAASVSYGPILERVQRVMPDVVVVQGQSRQVLRAADFAFVASGTATLEAGFLAVPMVVVYKAHPITAWLARYLLRIPYIALANIIAGKRIVPELLQQHVRPPALAELALRCLEQPQEAQRIRAELGVLRQRMDQRDSARQAAACVGQFLRLAYAETASAPPATGP